MDYVSLGRSGLKVSRACLGAMNFGTAPGSPTDEAEAGRMIDLFLDAGHNFIDTSNWYNDGTSEEVVGRALRGRRESVVIATKGFSPIGPGPNDRGLSRAYLVRAVEASLRRLGTDYIDLYQCHRADPDTPIAETMETLAGLIRAGKVRYIGASEFTGSQIVDAQWAAERVGGIPFVSNQPEYSLIARGIETDILPACARHGMGSLVWSPLGGGLLTGKYTRGGAGDDSRFKRNDVRVSDRHLAIARELDAVAAEIGASPSAVAIAWVLGRRHVTSAIIGPRTLLQLEDNLTGISLSLPREAVQRLNTISKPESNALVWWKGWATARK